MTKISVDTTFGIDESSSIESEKILQEATAVTTNSIDKMFPSVSINIQETFQISLIV
ncbi:MAG: hypothetical protein ACPGQP_03985 [Nitrosopumilus sp.]